MRFSTGEAAQLSGVSPETLARLTGRRTLHPERVTLTDAGERDRLRWPLSEISVAAFLGEVRAEALRLYDHAPPHRALRRFASAIREGAADPITPCGSADMF